MEFNLTSRLSRHRHENSENDSWILVPSPNSPANNTHDSELAAHVNPQSRCRIFDLPTELRVDIYERTLLLRDDAVVDLGRVQSKHHLAILQTCRCVLAEAEDIFYSLHRFIFCPESSRKDLSSHLKPLGPRRRHAITALTVCTSSGSTAFCVMQQLHRLPNLQSCYFQRKMSVRYLGLSTWSVLAKQMQAELAKLDSLREVKMITPPARSELTDAEEKRKEKLRSIDAMLERG